MSACRTGGRKIEGEKQYCRQVCAFIKTSPFSPGETYYGNVASETLMSPSQDSRDTIEAAMRALDRVWISGHRYAKAGVMLNDFTPSGVAQLNLFDEIQPRANSKHLMRVKGIVLLLRHSTSGVIKPGVFENAKAG
ncbi:DinB/UmuC family translesion DNA polymerase [Pantoea allii]|uniref:DinB/UmuC family translesion DNA polymerase n=1 Tax=Pantoea allii TaxID=574096 RepID=UPI0031345774